MRRIRHDVSYLTSAGLLVVAAVTATTGLVSDLWDLNEFVYHKYAGYTISVAVGAVIEADSVLLPFAVGAPALGVFAARVLQALKD